MQNWSWPRVYNSAYSYFYPPNNNNADDNAIYICNCASFVQQDTHKWTGFTVISVSLREGRTLLSLAVVTCSVKHAFSLVRLVYMYRYRVSLAHYSNLMPGFIWSSDLTALWLSLQAEQCSVCGSSCRYLPITDQVGEFLPVITAGYCFDVTSRGWWFFTKLWWLLI